MKTSKDSTETWPLKAKILVVDDEWSMQELLRHTLALSGFDVLMARDDIEFRQCVFAEKPDVIILDIMLGDKDGVQVYQKLLEEGLDRNIPVIFLSALAQDRPPSPPRPGRQYALIGKPFDTDQLVRELRELVSLRAA